LAGGGFIETALPLRVTGYPPVADRREAVARVVRISPRLIYRAEASKMRRRIVSTVYYLSSFHFGFALPM
jgi:hypothetical protein